jgi:hypothetical protein
MSDEKNRVDELENEAGDEEEENEDETDNEEPEFASYDEEEEMENIANERSPKPEAPAIAPQMRPARRGGGFMDGIRQPAMPLQAPAPAKTKLGFGVPPVQPPTPPVEQKPEPKVEAKPEPKAEAKPEELVLNLQQSDFEAFAKDEPTYKPAILAQCGGFEAMASIISMEAEKAKANGKKASQAYMTAVTHLLSLIFCGSIFSETIVDQYRLVSWYALSTLFQALGTKAERARAEARKVIEGIVARKLAEAADQDRNAMNGPPPMPKAEAKPEEAAKPEAKLVEPPKEEPKAEATAETKAEPKSEPKPEAGKVIQLRRPADAAIAPTVEAPTPAPLSQPMVTAAAKTAPLAGPKTPTPTEVRAKVGAEVAKGGFGRPEPLAPAAGAIHPVVPPDPSALPPAPIGDRGPVIPEPPVVRQDRASGPHPAAIAAIAIQQVEMKYSPIKPEPRLPTENAADKPAEVPKTEAKPTAKPEKKSAAKPAGKDKVSITVVLFGCALMLTLGALVFLGYVHYGPKPQTTAAATAQRQLVCEHVTPALITSHFNQSDPAHFPNPGPRQSGKPYIECHGQTIFHDPARNTFDIRKCDVCYWK